MNLSAPFHRRLTEALLPARATIPTTDLYFLNACRDWARRGMTSRPILREGANSFSCGDLAIVCRRDTSRVVNRLLGKARRLIYVIDDDLWAAEEDQTLPMGYRHRLIELREGQHKHLAEQAETIVVSSPALVARYAVLPNVVALDPHWSDPLADDRHFDQLAAGGPLEIGYLGSASHAVDRAFVFAVFARLLDKDERIRATIVGGADLPAPLRGHPRLRVLDPLPWPRHRQRLRRLRFHLLLYPTLPTPFNRARSINKLIEHAVSGGVGIYSDTWQFAGRVVRQKAGLLVENEVDAWIDVLLRTSSELGILLELHRASRQVAQSVNDQTSQRSFWSEALDLTRA